MASRRETRQQQQGVEQALRALVSGGGRQLGVMLPSVSDIAQEHGVSRYIAHRALQIVGEEGLLHAVPKVGSFAGNSDAGMEMSQVFLTDEASLHPYRADIQIGFDSRVAARGAAALSLELSAVSGSWRQLPVGGVFLLAREERLDALALDGPFTSSAPSVRIGSRWREGERFDLVSFDDEDGGFRATRHLIERGFKSIAFLGVHVPSLASSAKEWSGQREEGWRRALREAGLPFHGMAFWPRRESNDDEGGAKGIGRFLGREMLGRGDVRAVVAANDAVAMGLLQSLREAGVPRDEWPAIVAFDNSEAARRDNITSIHLPWDEIGREAADLLWSRLQGQLPPEPQHRAVAMRLIPRLSCREKWPSLYLTG
jgi:DNA-binding LacI/PurR family transcriptional regulator